jgi:hypothetical protein
MVTLLIALSMTPTTSAELWGTCVTPSIIGSDLQDVCLPGENPMKIQVTVPPECTVDLLDPLFSYAYAPSLLPTACNAIHKLVDDLQPQPLPEQCTRLYQTTATIPTLLGQVCEAIGDLDPNAPEVGVGCGGILIYACAGWDASCHSWAGGNCAATAKGFHGGLGAGTGKLLGDDPGAPCTWIGTGCQTTGIGRHVGPNFKPCVTAMATSTSAVGFAFDAATFCAP